MKAKIDALEVTINMVVGLILNYLLTVIMFGVSLKFALGTSVIFFCCSWIRSYIIRRVFRKNDDE